MLLRKEAIASIAAALAAYPRSSTAQGTTTIRISTPPNASIVPLFYGMKSNRFKQAGLNIEYTKLATGVAIASAVAGGAFDIGVSPTLSVIYAHARDIPFRIVAPTDVMTPDSEAGLIVLNSSPLRSAKDFVAKTVAIQGANDINALAMKAWLDQSGADWTTLKFLELPQSAAPAILVEGKVDGICVTPPYSTIATSGGNAKILAAIYAAIAPRVLVGCYFANADWISRNREAVTRFARVMADSALYLNAHYDEARTAIAEFTGLDRAIIDRMKKVTRTGTIDVAHIQPMIDLAVKYRLLEHGFSANELLG